LEDITNASAEDKQMLKDVISECPSIKGELRDLLLVKMELLKAAKLWEQILQNEEINTALNKLKADLGTVKTISDMKTESAELQTKIDKSQQKSETAGKARTGLFAVDTLSNVAGAIVSSKTIGDKNFIEQINRCTETLDLLQTARARLKFEAVNEVDARQIDLSQQILNKCSDYKYVNLSSLNNIAKGAVITNSAGAVSGTVATITSVLGNSKNISHMGTDEEVGKYEKINMASNVMGGVTAAASLTGTVLNALQIKTVKQILSIAQNCEDALSWY
jgi:hypothetical protein